MKYHLLAGATLIALATTPAFARPMTPEDILNIKNASDLAVSPDGKGVAIGVSEMPDIDNGAKNGTSERRLHVGSAANALKAFLPEDMNVSGLEYSPDGKMISFLWKPDGDDAKRALYGIPVDGGGHQKLASIDDSNVTAYAWAPDSQTIYVRASAATDKARKKQSKAGFDAIIYEIGRAHV